MISNGLTNALNFLMKEGGKQISVKYFTNSMGSIYDDADTLTLSGSVVWTSGIVFGLDPNSSEDNLLLEQGKIGTEDKRLYTNGSLIYSNRTGSIYQTKIGLGSPGTDWFSLILNGGDSEETNNVAVYKKAYIRRLTTGSLVGE